MRLLCVATVLFVLGDAGAIQTYMQHAFYPVLLGILLIASLGVPIPEDVPLIAAGVLLRTHPGIASWPGTLLVALVGIMAGDLILYRLGRVWGPGVVNHRFVRRLITPRLYRRATQKFYRYGMWYCFFGRFFLGIRGAMCLTAGATRFPYWRFFLADFGGALLSIPFFVYLGYWFTGMVPRLRAYTTTVQILLTVTLVLTMAAVVYYKVRRNRRRRQARAANSAAAARAAASAESPTDAPISPQPAEPAAARKRPEPPRDAETDK